MLRRILLFSLVIMAAAACRSEKDLFSNLQTDVGPKARYAVEKPSADKWTLRIVVTDVKDPKKVGAIRNYLIGRVVTENEQDMFQAVRTRGKRWYRGWEDDLSGGLDTRRDDLIGWVLDYELNFDFDKQPAKPKGDGVTAIMSGTAFNRRATIPLGIEFVRCEGAKPYC